MAPESFLLDPALEELLLEVAADPDSSLLRVPRPKALPALFDNDPRVSDRMAGLNLAERELLRVHRAELAELLLEVCRYKLIEGPRSGLVVVRYRSDGRTHSPLSPDDAAALAERRHVEFDREEASNATALINQCVTDAQGPTPSIAELAAAAARLSPSNGARGLASQHFAQGAAPRFAVRALRNMLERGANRADAATAWSTLGVAWSHTHNYERAHDAYVMASTLQPDYLPAAVSRLVLACQCGRTTDALGAASRAEEIGTEHREAVANMLNAMTVARQAGEWRPTAVAAATAITIHHHLRGLAKEIVDVLR